MGAATDAGSGERGEGTGVAAGELTRRVMVAAVGIPLTVLLIWLGSWYLGGVMAFFAAASAREFFDLAAARGVRPLAAVGIPAAAALPLLATAFPTFESLAPWAFALLMTLALLVMATVIWTRGSEGEPMAAAGATVMGAFYPGGTLAFALLLRHLPDAQAPGPSGAGALLIALPLAVTWFGDSCAYFAGKRWGRRKLSPAVSPGKTVVGGVAGLLGAIFAAVVVSYVGLRTVPEYGVGPLAAVLIGGALGVGAQVGDLAESVLKREAGVKDSGALLPGHGGALDRFDALFYTIPLCYVLVVLNGGLF